MTTQTTNNSRVKIIRGLFGKALALVFLFGIMSVASYAQSNNLYYINGGAYYGRVTVFPGSHFEIDLGNGQEIKTFRNSCSPVSSGGVPGVLCTFAHFKYGQHIYSGRGYFFQNGLVYLTWTNENIAGQWRQINTGWYGFRP